ncbi:DUF5391 family protein [Sporolactobacillus putidus]|uniref:DUF5391 family protein n=1 Tax=Sporolactobacillus putidus TaxID=492735 RepID=UPI001E540526|nr:DUF5391 family protein [Sporolactobacillus putidus]
MWTAIGTVLAFYLLPLLVYFAGVNTMLLRAIKWFILLFMLYIYIFNIKALSRYSACYESIF